MNPFRGLWHASLLSSATAVGNATLPVFFHVCLARDNGKTVIPIWITSDYTGGNYAVGTSHWRRGVLLGATAKGGLGTQLHWVGANGATVEAVRVTSMDMGRNKGHTQKTGNKIVAAQHELVTCAMKPSSSAPSWLYGAMTSSVFGHGADGWGVAPTYSTGLGADGWGV